jgi:hypothetical protein
MGQRPVRARRLRRSSCLYDEGLPAILRRKAFVAAQNNEGAPLTWSNLDAPIARTQPSKQSLQIALRHRSLPLVDQTTHDDLVWEGLDRTEHGLIWQ